MTEKRILSALGDVNEKYIKEADPRIKPNKKTGWRMRTSIAACFMLVVVLGIGIFYGGWFGSSKDIAALNNGDAITFTKSDGIAGSTMDLNVITRELTAEELDSVFADLPVTAFAYFDAEKQNLLGFEGKIDGIKLIISTTDRKLVDTVIEGDKYDSEVQGVFVKAGYFITKANSQGVKTAIYYATFELGGNTVYIEHAGTEENSERVKNEVATAIQQLIQHGAFDSSKITD